MTYESGLVERAVLTCATHICRGVSSRDDRGPEERRDAPNEGAYAELNEGAYPALNEGKYAGGPE